MQYVVQAGDTLSSIAQRFGTTLEALVQANNISNPNLIYVGQIIIIPSGPTPVPPPPPPTTVCPQLSMGAKGPAVRRLQTLLANAGVNPGVVDGDFGPRTEAAVRTFQSQKGLAVTGVVNVATWTALGVNCGVVPGPVPPTPPPQEFHCPVLRLGAVGPSVRLLQRLLKEKGFFNATVDGDFGGRTQRAVREFQRSQGLSVTGVVDAETWRALGVCCCEEPVPPTGTPIATTVGMGIRHILFTNRRVYEHGESVKITLVKTNVTSDEITLRYSTSQIEEVTVTNSAGQVVWTLSQNKTFAQFQRIITIYPGGTQVIDEYWNQLNNSGSQVPPGIYTVTAKNLGTNVSLSVQIQIR